MDFEEALVEVIKQMGPVKAFTLRYYVSRSVEEIGYRSEEFGEQRKNCKDNGASSRA